MKRIVSFLLVLVMAFSMVACGAKEVTKTVEAEEPVVPVIPVKYDVFRATFDEKVSNISWFEATDFPDADLEDGGKAYSISIKNTVLDNTYHVGIYITRSKSISNVSVFAEREADLSTFALLSFYLYEAMELPEIEAEDFYEQFNLLSNEDILESEKIEGYMVSTIASGEYVTFSIFAPEGALPVEQVLEEDLFNSDQESDEIETPTLQVYPLNSEMAYWEFAVSPPDYIYNTLGSENGLGGTIYSFSGTVEAIEPMDAAGVPVEYATVMTDRGPVIVLNMYHGIYEETVAQFGEDTAKQMYSANADYYVFPAIGEKANFLTVYDGYSKAKEMPVFHFGASADVFDIIGYDDPVAAALTKQLEEKEDTEAEQVAEVSPDKAPTMGEKNALSSARSYLKYSAFSYTGLVGQLEYEGYTYDEAVYAVENCGADWKEQAAKAATSYLKYSAFSYTGLIEQLEYEGYTYDEAVYGVDSCGADWNEQAAKLAESYLKYSSFSRDGLIEQLQYEGFTYDQAVYGVEANGY